MPDLRLRKSERLSGKNAVTAIFESGEGGFVFPFKYLVSEAEAAATDIAVMISVPKRIHKRANVRNTLKRRTREAYRLNKSPLWERFAGRRLHIAFIYVSKEVEPYHIIEASIRKIIDKLTTSA